MTSRRRATAILLVGSGVVAGCATTDPPAAGRAERVATAERRMWDRYGDLASASSETTSEAAALADMVAHHEDAIAGAEALLAHDGLDPDVKAFAERIARVQREQVATMDGWLDAWYPGVEIVSHWEPLFTDPTTTSDQPTFLATMIEHHEHAIAMYASWITVGTVHHHDMGLLAARIAKGQEGEIAIMRQLAAIVGAQGDGVAS